MQLAGGKEAIAVTVRISMILMIMLGSLVTGLGVHISSADKNVQQGTPTPDSVNNTTVQHERPSKASQSGDSQRVSQWLERRLTTKLQQSSVELSQGEYDRARELLGDDYDSRLKQYVDVSGETGSDSDDQASEVFEDTQETQQELTNATESYRDTYREYQDAREAENATAIRQTARELEVISGRVSDANQTLIKNYQRIENKTGISTNESQEAVVNTTQAIIKQQAVVRDETFVETRLRIETNRSNIAFTEPMSVTGQVTTLTGNAVINKSATVAIGERTYKIRTSESGTFTITYRPVLLSVNTTNATIRYSPAPDSRYLGNKTTVQVNVTQVSPSLSATTTPAEVGFMDSIETRVIATVGGRPVPSLPIKATIRGAGSSSVTTQEGTASITQRIQANVLPGQQPVQVEQPQQAAAVGPAINTTTVNVTQTETSITVAATPRQNTARVAGQLTTIADAGVPNQTVTVTVGTTSRTTVTDSNGRYQIDIANISRSENTSAGAVPVIVRFDATETNLVSAEANTTVDLIDSSALSQSADVPSGGGSDSSISITGRMQQLLAILFALASAITALSVVAWVRRTDTSAQNDAKPETDLTPAPENKTANNSLRLIKTARAALASDDPKKATIEAYSTVRRHLQQQQDVPTSLTHREFTQEATAKGQDFDLTQMSTVFDAYEQAAFAGNISYETANNAIEAASIILPDPDGE